MKRGLTSYGDAEFSLFLRKAFIKGAGYSDSALDRPVIGITDTGSGYNPCHGNMPQLLEAVERGMAFVPGAPFFADEAEHNTLRLSYVTVSPAQINQGIAALAAAIRALQAK